MFTQTNQKKASGSLFKKLGFLGIGLCGLCCALPIVGALAGVGAFSIIAAYFEKIGLALIIASVGLLALGYVRRRKTPIAIPSCSVDCGCQEGNSSVCTSIPDTHS